MQEFIEENVKNPQEPILMAAVRCLKPFLQAYYSNADEKLISSILHQARNSQNYARCFTLALAKFSRPIFMRHVYILPYSFLPLLK